MIWTIIGVVIAIILGATAIFFHQKKRKRSWIPAILAILALLGSGWHVRNELMSHNNRPRTTRPAKRVQPRRNNKRVNNRKPNRPQAKRNVQRQQRPNNKNHKSNKRGLLNKNSSKWAKLKHKIIAGGIVVLFMILLTGAIAD